LKGEPLSLAIGLLVAPGFFSPYSPVLLFNEQREYNPPIPPSIHSDSMYSQALKPEATRIG